jgi:hypothetical protein
MNIGEEEEAVEVPVPLHPDVIPAEPAAPKTVPEPVDVPA